MNEAIRQLLATADLLIENNDGSDTSESVNGAAVAAERTGPTALTATPASRCRGAAFALRAALEGSVSACLTAHGAPRTIREGSMRSAFLWLRSCTEAGTARRAKATWSQLCLGCHYHQYESGPTENQVRAWQSEVLSVVALLSP